jgi:hypothetical protein
MNLAGIPLRSIPAGYPQRCYDFRCQELPATFLDFHDVFFLYVSEEPEPVKSDG